MSKKVKDFLFILAISIIPTLLIWLPFFLKIEKFWNIPLGKDGLATVVANYDGPLYLVVAKSFYNQEIIKQIVSFPLPTEYYAAHFPLFPLLIKIIALGTGYPYGMLLATLISSVLCLYFFFLLTKTLVNKSQAMWLTFIFSIFPARWFITRSVGSPEPLFLAAILASTYYFNQKKYWRAGIWGALAQLTKSPGILLFFAYLLAIILERTQKITQVKSNPKFSFADLKKYLPLFLIPISLISVFLIYKIRMNDFFAYFHSGDNIHLLFPPFQAFNYSAPWVGTFWLEEIILVYILAAWGIIKLFQKKEFTFASISLIFFISIIFVAHRDIIRYLLPAVPFLLLSYRENLTKKEFYLILILIIIPIYLFSLNFISQNKMPIADWGPLL